MKLSRLTLENFRRHEATEIQFPEGLSAIVGANGSGKSTLLEAIGFALFGARAARTQRDLIRRDDAPPGDAVRVTLELELGGQLVEIVRELRGKNGTPHAGLTVDGVVLVQPGTGSNEPATQEIERRLGMDREAFFATVVAQQKQLSRLADHDPAVRKRLILDMMGVSRVDDAIATARQSRRDLEARLVATREALPDEATLKADEAQHAADVAAASKAERTAKKTLDANVATLHQAAARLDAAKKQTAARSQLEADAKRLELDLQKLEASQARLHADLEKASRAAARMEELAKVVGELPERKAQAQAAQEATWTWKAYQAEQAAWEQTEKRRAEWNARLSQPAIPAPEPVDVGPAQDAYSAATATHAAAAAELAQTERRIEALDALDSDAPCPTCEQPLGEHRDKALIELGDAQSAQQATLATAAKALADAKAKLAEFQTEMDAHQAAVRAHELDARDRKAAEAELARLASIVAPEPRTAPEDPAPLLADVARLEALEKQRVQAEAHAQRQPELAAQVPELQHELEHIRKSLEASAQQLAELPSPDADAEPNHHQAEAAVSAAQSALSQAQGQLVRLDERKTSLTQRRAQLEAGQAKAAILADELTLWTALVGARSGGLLDDFKQHLISSIAPAIRDEGSRLMALFTNGRYSELFLDDDYKLYVGDGGRNYTLDRFSGGEQDLAHLALRLAVSRLLARRTGTQVRFLALDEVFGALDSERRGHVLHALDGLGTLYDQVLLITHHEALRDALDQTLEVVLDGGVSRVHAHNG